MALLKRKQEKTGIASIRLPMSAIQELQTLRKLADDKGYDLNASMADALLKWMKQAREELSANNDAEDKAVSTNPNNLLGRVAPTTASSPTTAGSESLSAPLAQPLAVAGGSNGSPNDRG